MKRNWCGLKDDEMKQCCCSCTKQIALHYNCRFDPPPHKKRSKHCSCDQIKGYVCTALEYENRVQMIPRHSVGCEMYEDKNANALKILRKRYKQNRKSLQKGSPQVS